MDKKTLPILLLDLDGTLLGGSLFKLTPIFYWRVLMQLQKIGGPWDRVMSLRQMRQAMKGWSAGQLNLDRALDAFSARSGLDRKEAQPYLIEALLKVFPTLEKFFYPIPGAKDFVTWAKSQGFELVLATQPIWVPEIVEYRVKWAGLELSDFKWITHAGKMHATKPHHEFYQEVLAHEGITPDQAWMIGNEIKMDLPASHIGIKTWILRQESARAQSEKTLTHNAWSGTWDQLKKRLVGDYGL